MEASGVKDAILSGMNDDESSYVSHTDQLLSFCRTFHQVKQIEICGIIVQVLSNILTNFHHAFYFLMTPAFS
jgi:hypothetical protein